MKNTGVENAGLENLGPNGRGGKGRTGKRGTKFAGVEIAGLENTGPILQGWRRSFVPGSPPDTLRVNRAPPLDPLGDVRPTDPLYSVQFY